MSKKIVPKKQLIIPSISIISLSLLLIWGIQSLPSTKPVNPAEKKEYINGVYIEKFKSFFDDNIAIKEKALTFWSSIKFSLFKEGNNGVLIGSDIWLFTTEEFDESLTENQNRSEFFKRIEHVNRIFKDKNIFLIIALIPSKTRTYEEKISQFKSPEKVHLRYGRALEELSSKEINFADLDKRFQRSKAGNPLFYKYDTHWTYEGAMAAADEIYAVAKNLIEKYDLPERAYYMNEESPALFEGDLLQYIPSYKPLMETYYNIEVIDGDPPVLDLFDSPEIPVILVGTSYSFDPRWNFEDALKMSLKLDILNLAEEGKGPFPSMDELIESEYYLEINAKIIIWEIPERYIPIY